jgi:hypothetical protein
MSKLTKLAAAATAVSLTLGTPALAQTVYYSGAVGYPDGWARVGAWGCSMNNADLLAIYPAPSSARYLYTNDPQVIGVVSAICTSSGKWFWAHVTTGVWDATSIIPQR